MIPVFLASEAVVRTPIYDPKAPKQTVSLTLNSDLYAKAKSFDINASRVAEEALAYAVRVKLTEQVKREVAQDIALANAYIAAHGHFGDSITQWMEQERVGQKGVEQSNAAETVPVPKSLRSKRRRR